MSAARVREALAWLERKGTRAQRDGLARYGITAPRAFGVKMAAIQQLARQLGRDHDLALALWDTGWYEARLLTAYVDEPERVTSAQMDRWVRAFDNWAVCDTLCFSLWDRTPLAWKKIEQWRARREEFVKRASFALLASVALHDKQAADAPFVKSLKWIAAAADDERNFVKKGVSWALRSVGHRGPALHRAAMATAHALAASEDASARWVGKDALRDLGREAVKSKVSKASKRDRSR